jgi:hypothetical protein
MIFTKEQEKEIHEAVEHLVKLNKKVAGLSFFVASKTRGNAVGDGANRSVILLKYDGIEWKQGHKVWGKLNNARAHTIVEMAQEEIDNNN